MKNVLQIVERGIEDYKNCLHAMREYTINRTADTPDQIWIVEHDAVFTLGLGANPLHILNPHAVPVIQSDRGGEVTFHGPGQVIVYILIDLKRRKNVENSFFPRQLIKKIEYAVIETLATYNLYGVYYEKVPGVYIKSGMWRGSKIAALGLKICSNYCTYHGVALNVAMDLTPFSWINACGCVKLTTVDMRTLGVTPPLHEVQFLLARKLVMFLS